MTVEKVSIKPRRKELTADGVLTDFDFDFKIFAEGDVTVYLRDLSDVSVLQTITTEYTVAFNSEAETGTISFVTPPTNLFIVLMLSAADYEQQTDIPKGGGFSEPVVEKGYDLLEIQIQQLREDLDRAVTLSATSPLTSVELPDPAVADAPIGWDPTATFLVNNPNSTNLSQIDAAATPDFIGASSGDGVLRTGASLSYADGGDFVTLNTIQDITSGASPTFDGANFTGVDAVNVDIADSGALITATEVEGALAENRALIDTNTTDIGTNTTNIGTNTTDIGTNVTAIGLNTSKVTNATHTVDVTGSGALTLDPVAITNKPAATVAAGDLVLVADIDAANALKQVTAQSIADLGAGGGPVQVLDEGVSLTATVSSMDFVGAGVTATTVGSAVTVTIAGGGSALEVEDEGISLSTAVTKFNFAGAGVTVTEPVADQMLVTIPAGATGGNFIQAFDNTDLAAGVLSVNHALANEYNQVQVFNNNGDLVLPDDVTLVDANNLTVDLSGFGAISNTPNDWRVVVLSAGGSASSNATDLALAGQATGDIAIFDGTNWVAQGGVEKIKTGSVNRTLTDATGTVPYTGIGFKPSFVLFFSGKDASQAVSWGMDTGSAFPQRAALRGDGTTSTNFFTTSSSVYIAEANGTDGQNATISSFDTDGFTLSWTKFGSPTGVGTVNYTAFR